MGADEGFELVEIVTEDCLNPEDTVVDEAVPDAEPDDEMVEIPDPLREDELPVALASSLLHVTRLSEVSATTALIKDCCAAYQDVGAKWSPSNVTVKTPELLADDVTLDPVIEAEQPVTVEQGPVMVDVVNVVLPAGVKTEYDVSQALVVRTEQELDAEDEAAEEAEVLEEPPSDFELLSSSSSPSSSRFEPISPSVSVKSSILPKFGVFLFTSSSIFEMILLAQLSRVPTAFTAPLTKFPMLPIMPLSAIRALSCLSERCIVPSLFRFVFVQSGVSGGFTFRSAISARVCSCVFLTFSRNWDFNLGSVSHCRFACSARNRPAIRTA